MSNKYSKMIAIYILCLCIVGLIGLSAAFFTSLTPSESGSTLYAKGGTMSVKYDNKSGNISVSNIYPREEAWVTKRFQVIGNNTTDLLMFYKVKLVIDRNEFTTALSYTLTGTNTSNSGELIPDISNNAPIGLSNVTLGSGYHVKGNDSTHAYTLQIFFKPSEENQNYGQEANFAAHLVIEIDDTSTEKSPSNWDNAGSNTLLAGIKKNYTSPTKTLTNPVTNASASNEAVMSLTPDDYGISYYFRGNVQNNYVRFAGMCWRIVRITGDGSIKLVLFNNDSISCTKGSPYAEYEEKLAFLPFSDEIDFGNESIGLMYGELNSSTYADAHKNEDKSYLLVQLEKWYKNKLTYYTDKLADVIWCNDKSTLDSGYNLNDTKYAAYYRFYSEKENEFSYSYGTGPILTCPNDKNGGKLSKYTVDDTNYGNGNLTYKIGLLTIDELAFSGFSYNSSYLTSSSYLLDDTSDGFWTLSPAIFRDNTPYVFATDESGNMYVDIYPVSVELYLRPSIALKADTTISGGNGTASSPFIVN